MIDFIIFFSFFGLAFFVKNADGPFGIISYLRNFALRRGGVFFYELLNCYYCLGIWSGFLIYLISNHFILSNMNFCDFLLFGFASGSICYFFINIIDFLKTNSN